MRGLILALALTLLVVGCGGDDGGENRSASSPTSTTTSDEATTDPPDDDAFVAAIDEGRLRHGFDDVELERMGEDVCSAAEEDSTDPPDTRPGTSHTSAELARIYAGTSANPFPMPEEDAADIGHLAGEHLCPDLAAEVSHGVDIMLNDGM